MCSPLERWRDVANSTLSFCSADKASGYRTVNILCMPIKAADGSIVGVLQAINKKDGSFTPTDEDVMSLLATQAGIALQNANLFRNSESARDKFRSLLDIIRAMQGEMGVNSLIFTITQRTIRVVDADRCTLYLVDNVHRGLFAMQGEVSDGCLSRSLCLFLMSYLRVYDAETTWMLFYCTINFFHNFLFRSTSASPWIKVSPGR